MPRRPSSGRPDDDCAIAACLGSQPATDAERPRLRNESATGPARSGCGSKTTSSRLQQLGQQLGVTVRLHAAAEDATRRTPTAEQANATPLTAAVRRAVIRPASMIQVGMPGLCIVEHDEAVDRGQAVGTVAGKCRNPLEAHESASQPRGHGMQQRSGARMDADRAASRRVHDRGPTGRQQQCRGARQASAGSARARSRRDSAVAAPSAETRRCGLQWTSQGLEATAVDAG